MSEFAQYPVRNSGGGSGTVTSVGLSLPASVFNVTGSPVTTSGTLTGNFNNQSANTVFAGPASGPSAPPTFRPLVVADIPALPYASDSFTIIQTDHGTFPTASSATDTLTLTNTDTHIVITGNSGSKSVTFNTTGLQPTGNYITALTGDATATGPGSVPLTLATVNASPGTYTYATLTVNGKGLITSASSGTAPVTSVTASSPLASSGGTTPNITIQQATTSQNGYLSSTDWNTFNNKQPAGNYITALTGDVTATGPGSAAATLATVNANVGTFTYSTVTVNAKGLVTAASSGAAPTGTVTSVALSSPGVIYTVSGSPVTTSGTLQLNLISQTANTFLAAPNGSNGTPTFRAIVSADLPYTTVVNKSANYTVVSSDNTTYFTLDTTTAGFTLTLPTPVSGFRIKFVDSTGNFSTNNLTLAPHSTEKISGLAASKVFQTNWGGWEVFSNGTDWFVI
jgi:trimeric autotransporter adhesin